MVMMKGQDGTDGKNGSQGDPGLPGSPGPPGLAGLKGAQGFCTKEQCESNELKLLIQRVLVVEKYVKDQQKQAPPQPPRTSAPGAVPGQGQPAPAGSPQGPNAPPLQPSRAGQGQPASAPSVPSGPPQGANTPPPQPSKPVPGQSQSASAPAGSPPPQPPKPAPAPAPAVPAVPAVPAGSPQVLWGTVTPSAASIPLSSPVGVTIQSTLEAPGTLLEGNGQIDIQGVVTPQVSMQRYNVMGNPGVQPGTAFKKSRISSHRAVTKPKHAHKKSKHHSTVRTHKS